MRHSYTRAVQIAGVVAAAALLAAACSSSKKTSGGGAGSSTPAGGDSSSSNTTASQCGTSDQITLTVGLFGTFGFKEAGLYNAYHQLCPNITIKEDDVEQSADYWTRLKTRLASGSGLDDVQGIEIGFVADVIQNHADQFVDFNSLPESGQLKSTFYDWKWNLATSHDGKTVGLGTDIGPEAICYRSDLYKEAGLPYQPDQVAAQMKSWDDFINFGKQYEASSSKPSKSHFVDSAASIFSTAVYQGNEAYDKPDGTPDVENSDGVQNAWKFATDAAAAKITAGLQQFSDPWNKAFQSGAFATIACPAWMAGYIKGQAGDAYKGKWNIAPVLPGGSTNWGGSWVGVPSSAKNKDAAIKFVEWVTAPAQQQTWFTKVGNFPSSKTADESPAIQNHMDAYFSNAPSGKIFTEIASKMKIPPIGLYDTQIQNALTTQLTNVETRGTSPDKAFNDALKAIEQVTG
jgi:cellobiose transport system substrate-binding protein